jgi:predicted dehydrogenase
VAVRPASSSWRTSRAAGGGCLYDYACHAIDMVHFLVGRPEAVAGTVLNRMFSEEAEDEVYTTLLYGDGKTGQLAANWSDDSFRKMALKVTLWGANGRIYVDRQEVQLYLSKPVPEARDLVPGWNVRYTTALTSPVWFYLRGEEYSAQIDHFIQRVRQGRADTLCPFGAGAEVDEVAAMLVTNAQGAPLPGSLPAPERVPFSGAL